MVINRYKDIGKCKIYPSGVIIPVGSNDDSLRNRPYSFEMDSEISELYKTVTESNSVAIEHVTALVDIAKRLLGKHKDQFLHLQHINGRLSDITREFIADTLNYIETGHRDMSIGTWLGLFLNPEWPGDTYEPKNGIISVNIAKEPNIYPKNVIAKWLAHPDGFMDMLTTFHVLFGNYAEKRNSNYVY